MEGSSKMGATFLLNELNIWSISAQSGLLSAEDIPL